MERTDTGNLPATPGIPLAAENSGKGANMIPKNLHIGQKCRFDPFEIVCGYGAEQVRGKVTGTVVAIYENHGWFSVEYGDPKQRSSFKFCEVGERVTLSG